MDKKNIIVISASSDIGHQLVEYYSKDNYVTGTFRTYSNQLSKLSNNNTIFVKLDINNINEVNRFSNGIFNFTGWDICFFCVGEPLPLTSFAESDFDQWIQSVYINSLYQLRLLHKLLSKRSTDASVMFFGSAGMNQSIQNFSAYTIGKTILCKMCELIAAENPDLRIFIYGPGWINTKMHQKILDNLGQNDERFIKTKQFLETDNESNKQKLIDQLEFLLNLPIKQVSGKNFCNTDELDAIKFWVQYPDIYKFRRISGEHWNKGMNSD